MLTAIGEQPDALTLAIDGTKAVIVVSVGVAVDTLARVLWIEDLRGAVGFRPKQNVVLMRQVIDECETLARENDAYELRIEANSRRGWKQKLLPMLGFEPHRVGARLVMRKALRHGLG
jgi:hypothetical protein